jgi:hypothetical protein
LPLLTFPQWVEEWEITLLVPKTEFETLVLILFNDFCQLAMYGVGTQDFRIIREEKCDCLLNIGTKRGKIKNYVRKKCITLVPKQDQKYERPQDLPRICGRL